MEMQKKENGKIKTWNNELITKSWNAHGVRGPLYTNVNDIDKAPEKQKRWQNVLLCYWYYLFLKYQER